MQRKLALVGQTALRVCSVLSLLLVLACAQTAAQTAASPSPLQAEVPASFPQAWKAGLRVDAIAAGVRPEVVDAALASLTPIQRAVKLDRAQPEVTFTFEEYLARVVTKQRIQTGRQMMRQHKTLLDNVAKTYGVQPRFIVALWGIETAYGKITGNFAITDVLATLAYEGRRAEFFRSEFVNALKMVDAGHIRLSDMKGSWAGAMGQCQFMPSSYLNFAQDFNGDGRKDIWGNQADVFASIANYLKQSGWSDEQTWGRVVKLPAHFPMQQQGREMKKTLAEWNAMGVRMANGQPLPNRPGLKASIVVPDDGSTAYLTYGNFDVLMRWNRSLRFAVSVGMVADAIGYGD